MISGSAWMPTYEVLLTAGRHTDIGSTEIRVGPVIAQRTFDRDFHITTRVTSETLLFALLLLFGRMRSRDPSQLPPRI